MRSHGYPAYTTYFAKPAEMDTKRGCVLCHPDQRISFHNYPRHLSDQHGIRVNKNGPFKVLRETTKEDMTVETSTYETHSESSSTSELHGFTGPVK